MYSFVSVNNINQNRTVKNFSTRFNRIVSGAGTVEDKYQNGKMARMSHLTKTRMIVRTMLRI